MLIVTPSLSSERAKRYFGESLTRDDYYTRGQEVAGEWFGKGATQLGLAGKVDQESYFALCDNQNPQTGEQLNGCHYGCNICSHLRNRLWAFRTANQ
jgi:hypothetical protein